MTVRLSLDAAALTRLLGDDPRLWLDLSQRAVDEVARAKIKPLLNDPRLLGVEARMRTIVEEMIAQVLDRAFGRTRRLVSGPGPGEDANASDEDFAESLRELVRARIVTEAKREVEEHAADWVAAAVEQARERIAATLPDSINRFVDREVQARLDLARRQRSGETTETVRSLLLSSATPKPFNE